MAVKIRLARLGKKNVPFYRIVAIDSRKKRDGEFLEELGSYNPLNGQIVTFHAEKMKNWIDKGAVVSDAVKRLQKIYRNQKDQQEPVSKEK